MSVYNLLLGVVGAGAAASSTVLGVAHTTTSPYGTTGFSAYPWNSSTGYGTKYTEPVGITLQSVAAGTCIDFNHTNTVVALGHYSATVTDLAFAYPWSNSTGFGTKYTGISLATYPIDVSFNPTSTVVYFTNNSATPGYAYPWSDATGFGTRYTNPGSLIGTYSVTFTPDNATLLLAVNASPYIHAYPWSDATGYGTKYANPATLPTALSLGVATNPTGTDVAISCSASPYIFVYPWSAGFGTKYANPATLPYFNGRGISFN